MFGYVRPHKAELLVKEYEMFRAAYCGLCTALKERYGALARYVINYDLTFLAMLMAEPGCTPEVCRGRCPASPCRKKQYLRAGRSFDTAADYSIILTWWKLKDAAADGDRKEKLGAAILMALLRRKYRKAAAAEPEFAEKTRKGLAELAELEKEKCSSMDAAADKFAGILQSAAQGEPDEAQRRVLSQLLYQLGRFIYLLDALDDYEKDAESGSYNPLSYRFETRGAPLSAEDRELISLTLRHSEGMIASAYELRDKNVYDGILSNIIYLGLEQVRTMVFDGRGEELKYTNSIHKQLRSKE